MLEMRNRARFLKDKYGRVGEERRILNASVLWSRWRCRAEARGSHGFSSVVICMDVGKKFHHSPFEYGAARQSCLENTWDKNVLSSIRQLKDQNEFVCRVTTIGSKVVKETNT